jgi:hypothetical protein
MEGYINIIKPYIWATLWSLVASLILTTGWYVLFSYAPDVSIQKMFINIYTGLNFWLGVGIWTIFYSLFITYPIVLFRKKATDNG